MPEKRENTKARLLDAGVAALLDQDVPLLVSGLTVEMVASRALTSVQTFHNLFPASNGGKRAFVQSLMSHLAVTPEWADEADQRLGASAAGPARAQTIRDLAFELASVFWNDRSGPMRLVARVLAPSNSNLLSKVDAAYRTMDSKLEGVVLAGLRNAGYTKLKQPLDFESVSALMLALLEGYSLRAHYDPRVNVETVAEALLAVMLVVVDQSESHLYIDDRAGDSASNAPFSTTSVALDNTHDDPETAIIEAASIEFAQRGYFATTRRHIAGRAMVSEEDLRALFPSNVDIIVGGLRDSIVLLRRRTENDLRIGRTPSMIITSFPLRLAQQVLSNLGFMDSMALVLSLHGAQAQVDATRIRDELYFPGVIADCIAAGQESGEITTALDAADLAITFTNNIIFRCLSRRDETAEQVAEAINRMFSPVLFAVDRPADQPPGQ